MCVQAFCAKCPMCKSNKTNLCGAVRKWTGNGIMKADDGVRFHHKESGKKIYHFVSTLPSLPALRSACETTSSMSSLEAILLPIQRQCRQPVPSPAHGLKCYVKSM